MSHPLSIMISTNVTACLYGMSNYLGYRHIGRLIDRRRPSGITLSGSLVMLLAWIQCWYIPAYVALVSLLRANLYPHLIMPEQGTTIHSLGFM